MIQRSVNVNDLEKFDFYNDAGDTIHYLAYDRKAEAEILQKAYDAWLENYVKEIHQQAKSRLTGSR